MVGQKGWEVARSSAPVLQCGSNACVDSGLHSVGSEAQKENVCVCV
jgi:hypothetical protein